MSDPQMDELRGFVRRARQVVDSENDAIERAISRAYALIRTLEGAQARNQALIRSLNEVDRHLRPTSSPGEYVGEQVMGVLGRSADQVEPIVIAEQEVQAAIRELVAQLDQIPTTPTVRSDHQFAHILAALRPLAKHLKEPDSNIANHIATLNALLPQPPESS